MKKDIVIPEVKDIHVVAINEWSEDFGKDMWYVYLLNASEQTIEMPIVVSQASGKVNGEEKKTASLRHTYQEVAPFNAIRIEILTNELLELNNNFQVTFFQNNQLYDKKYIFKAKSISLKKQVAIEAIQAKGIFAQ
ncbi:MAG: hypothetical protein H6584_09040 [Flavobacteriales bacterium]|nr:hypothetical protein [Flavobacteriales bacterium]